MAQASSKKSSRFTWLITFSIAGAIMAACLGAPTREEEFDSELPFAAYEASSGDCTLTKATACNDAKRVSRNPDVWECTAKTTETISAGHGPECGEDFHSVQSCALNKSNKCVLKDEDRACN